MPKPSNLPSLNTANVAQLLVARPVHEVSAVLEFMVQKYGDNLIEDLADGLRIIEHVRDETTR